MQTLCKNTLPVPMDQTQTRHMKSWLRMDSEQFPSWMWGSGGRSVGRRLLPLAGASHKVEEGAQFAARQAGAGISQKGNSTTPRVADVTLIRHWIPHTATEDYSNNRLPNLLMAIASVGLVSIHVASRDIPATIVHAECRASYGTSINCPNSLTKSYVKTGILVQKTPRP